MAVMVFGSPGAGKGTQANLLSWRYGFIHFDTGRFLEQYLHDPANQKDPIVKRERKIFDSGVLNTPEWVLEIVSKKTQDIAEAGFSIVYSGSPRTMFEAAGDKEHQGLIATLERLYGKKNVIPLVLKVKPDSSTHRNVNRRICAVCKNAVLYTDEIHAHKTCPICGGELKKRILDNPETMKVRLKEYAERTKPIFERLKKRGYKVIEINGEPEPYKVHEEVLKYLEK